MKQKLESLLLRYGAAALVVHFTLFFLSWSGFAVAIATGFQADSATSTAGTVGAAYLATQAIKPLRIGATLLLTPPAARLWQRLRPGGPAAPNEGAPVPSSPEAESPHE